jgi:hypothetical protein
MLRRAENFHGRKTRLRDLSEQRGTERLVHEPICG